LGREITMDDLPNDMILRSTLIPHYLQVMVNTSTI
jgi:hypothetical protein